MSKIEIKCPDEQAAREAIIQKAEELRELLGDTCLAVSIGTLFEALGDPRGDEMLEGGVISVAEVNENKVPVHAAANIVSAMSLGLFVESKGMANGVAQALVSPMPFGHVMTAVIPQGTHFHDVVGGMSNTVLQTLAALSKPDAVLVLAGVEGRMSLGGSFADDVDESEHHTIAANMLSEALLKMLKPGQNWSYPMADGSEVRAVAAPAQGEAPGEAADVVH